MTRPRGALARSETHTPTGDDPMAALGPQLKHARMVQGKTLRVASEAAGCSESMLSKIERGLARPSLAALHRLAAVLGSSVAELTTPARSGASPVQRASERPVAEFPASGRSRRGTIRLERVVVPAKGRLLQADIHVIEPLVARPEPISHAGEEVGYVLEGRLELTLGDERYLLEAGDSFHFRSEVPHGYRNPGRVRTRVLWVNTPPTF